MKKKKRKKNKWKITKESKTNIKEEMKNQEKMSTYHTEYHLTHVAKSVCFRNGSKSATLSRCGKNSPDISEYGPVCHNMSKGDRAPPCIWQTCKSLFFFLSIPWHILCRVTICQSMHIGDWWWYVWFGNYVIC